MATATNCQMGLNSCPTRRGRRYTRMFIEKGKVRLSDRVIFGLLAVAVLSPANTGQTVPDGYHLTFGRKVVLLINEWWGRVADFASIAAQQPLPRVKLDFGDWTDQLADT